MPIVLRRILLIALIVGVGVLIIVLPKLFHSKRIVNSSLIIRERAFLSDSLTKENIIIALRGVIDPEIGINIYDLGLISEIKIEKDDKVTIGLLLTTPDCPLINELQDAIKESVGRILKVKGVKVYLDKKNTWTPERMTEQGKRQFKEGEK
ncbi:MAG: iron-sulfur cluster assembly protein [candidate division WOR-3 bacterium]|nr:iron-sulfur cluster assembly protein [candidate division WOR-3 bacterium]